MSQKTEFPSSARLQQLREQGIVPTSPLANACWLAAALITFLQVSEAQLTALPARLRSLVESELPLQQFIGPYGKLLISCCALALVVQYAMGLLQARFLFRFETLLPQLGRIPLFSGFDLRALLSRCLLALATLLLAVVLMAVVAVFSLGGILRLVVLPRTELLGHLQDAWQRSAPAASAILALLGVLCWALARIGFIYRHRMTRQELLAEQSGE